MLNDTQLTLNPIFLEDVNNLLNAVFLVFVLLSPSPSREKFQICTKTTKSMRSFSGPKVLQPLLENKLHAMAYGHISSRRFCFVFFLFIHLLLLFLLFTMVHLLFAFVKLLFTFVTLMFYCAKVPIEPVRCASICTWSSLSVPLAKIFVNGHWNFLRWWTAARSIGPWNVTISIYSLYLKVWSVAGQSPPRCGQSLSWRSGCCHRPQRSYLFLACAG